MPIPLQGASQCESKEGWDLFVFNGPLHFPSPWSNLSHFSSDTEIGRSHELLSTHSRTRSQQRTTALDRFHRAHATWLLIKQPVAFATRAMISEVTRDLCFPVFLPLPSDRARSLTAPEILTKIIFSSQTLGGDSRAKREPQIPHLPLCHCMTKQQLASVTRRVTSHIRLSLHIRTPVGTDDACWQLVGLPSAYWESYCVWRWLTK